MSAHLISERGLIAAEDAYDAIATGSHEQINRHGIEVAIKAYLATDPMIAAASDLLEACRSAVDRLREVERNTDHEAEWEDLQAVINRVDRP